MKIVPKGKNAQTKATSFSVFEVGLNQVVIAPEGDPMANQKFGVSDTDVSLDIEVANGRYNVVVVAEKSTGQLVEVNDGKVKHIDDLNQVAVDTILTVADVPIAQANVASVDDAFAGMTPMEAMPVDFNLDSTGSPPPPPVATPDVGEAPAWDDENEWNNSTEAAAVAEEAPAAIPSDVSKTLTEIPPGEMPEELNGVSEHAVIEAAEGAAAGPTTTDFDDSSNETPQAKPKTISELEEEIADLKRKRDALNAAHGHDLGGTTRKLFEILSPAGKKVIKFDDQNSTLSQQIEEATQRIRELLRDIVKLEKEKAAETERADAAESEVSALKLQIAELQKPKPTVEGESPMKPGEAPAPLPVKSPEPHVVELRLIVKVENGSQPSVVAVPVSAVSMPTTKTKRTLATWSLVSVIVVVSLFGLLKMLEWIPSFKPALHDINIALGFPQSTETVATNAPSTIDEKRLADAERQLADNAKKLADANRELKTLSESQRTVAADRDKLQKLLATVARLKVADGKVALVANMAPQGTTQWSATINGKSLSMVPIATALPVADGRGFITLYFYNATKQLIGATFALVE